MPMPAQGGCGAPNVPTITLWAHSDSSFWPPKKKDALFSPSHWASELGNHAMLSLAHFINGILDESRLS